MKLPTIWTDEKHSQEEAEPGRNSDVEKVRTEFGRLEGKGAREREREWDREYVKQTKIT